MRCKYLLVISMLLMLVWGCPVFAYSDFPLKEYLLAEIKHEIAIRDASRASADIQIDILYVPEKLKKIVLSEDEKIALAIPKAIKQISGKIVVPVYIRKTKYNTIIKVLIYDDVLLAAEDIMKDQIINPNMLKKQKMDLSSVPLNVYRDPIMVTGKESATNIRKNTIVVGWMLRERILLRKNSIITIVAKVDAITVKCAGKLLQDARAGEIVLVENIAGGKKVNGKLLDDKTVLIEIAE